MIFKVSSAALLSVLQNASKVIAPKQTMPILDHFLFVLKEDKLSITATDLESTILSTIEVDGEVDGLAAIPAKLIMDALKELHDQPVKIDVNIETSETHLEWESGDIVIPAANGLGYPEVNTDLGEVKNEITLRSVQLLSGISKTSFAAASSDTKLTLNGVLLDVNSELVTFVATDARQLAKLTYNEPTNVAENCMVIIPRKGANLLRGILQKDDSPVKIEFGGRSILFKMEEYTFICRMIEGRYPNYNSVIPKNSQNKLIVDRAGFLSSIRRVSVCSNQGNNLVKLAISAQTIHLEAKDVDFSTSAKDKISCNYDGEPMTIGLKADNISEMLSALSCNEVTLEITDPTRAVLIVPTQSDDENEKGAVMLLMPVVL